MHKKSQVSSLELERAVQKPLNYNVRYKRPGSVRKKKLKSTENITTSKAPIIAKELHSNGYL